LLGLVVLTNTNFPARRASLRHRHGSTAIQLTDLGQIKQAPGFIKGEWFGDEKNGHGFVVFETEDQAKQGLQQVGEVFLGVKVTRSDVYRLHAEA